jgi:hypothetical protein
MILRLVLKLGWEHMAGRSFLCCPATVQITCSSVKLCIASRDVDWFHSSWNVTHILSFNIFCVFKMCLYFWEQGCILFMLLEVILYFYHWHILDFWNQIMCLTLHAASSVCDSLIGPSYLQRLRLPWIVLGCDVTQWCAVLKVVLNSLIFRGGW